MKKLIALAMVVGLSGCVVHVSKHKSKDFDRKEQTLTLQASDLRNLIAETDDGDVVIKGSDTDLITVDAVIRGPRTDSENYTLTLEKTGNSAILIAKLNSRFAAIYVGRSPSIDLVVNVPSSMLIDITDDSGDLEIQDINNRVSVNDDSGRLVIRNIIGGVQIDDDSGSIEMDNIQGSVTIDDDSGEIVVKHVQGDVTIDDDSGDVELQDIQGKITIDDESGDIVVRNAQALTIESDDSGDVIVRNVGQYDGQ